MTDEFLRIDLDSSAAVAFASEKLSGLGNLGGRLVTSLTGIKSAWTIVPPGAVGPSSVTDPATFETGGVGSPELADRWLTQGITAHLSTSPSAVILMHHRLARFGDPWTGRSAVRLNAFDDTICCLLDEATRDPRYIEGAVHEVPLPHRTTLFAEATVTAYLKHHEPDWFRQVVDEVLANWTILLVHAFDGETMIALDRTNQTRTLS